PVTAAPPTDWRQSWGKTEAVKSATTDKPLSSSADSKPAPTKPLLPQADTKRPDPLQMPSQYDRRPMDDKPSAQKSDALVIPAAQAGVWHEHHHGHGHAPGQRQSPDEIGRDPGQLSGGRLGQADHPGRVPGSGVPAAAESHTNGHEAGHGKRAADGDGATGFA